MVSGGADGDMKTDATDGVDTFVIGEGHHWTYALAKELRINVLYGGHYSTETFGGKALASGLSVKCKLPRIFVEYPTGSLMRWRADLTPALFRARVLAEILSENFDMQTILR